MPLPSGLDENVWFFISQAQLIEIVFLNDFPVVFLQGLFPDLVGILKVA
jgi:hypothetical protein